MVGAAAGERKNSAYHQVYHLLFERFGHQGWWPGETPFEIMVGAVLAQNTNWTNVTKAITGLKAAGLMTYESLALCGADEIAQYIRPAGYYNLKAQRLRNLLDMIEIHYGGQLARFLGDDMQVARENLLSVKGIGQETADSILLYSCGHPIFVVDMYTHRVFSRHNMVDEETDYQTMQAVFMSHLPHDVQLFNEFHALVVRVATTYCKKTKPLCGQCPLQGFNQ